LGELAEGLLDTLFGLPAGLIYLLVVVLCWAEGAFFLGFVTPGELAVAAGGILASRGQVAFLLLVGVVVVGTLAGNATGYALGRRFGAGILAWPPLHKAFGPSIARAQAFMRERGEWAIVLGRLATPTRIVVPFLAGVSRLPYRRYLAFDVPATLAWATAWVGLGYVLGESWEVLKDVAGTAALLVLVLFVMAVVIRWVTARVAANQRRVQAAFRVFLRATGTAGIARRLAPAMYWLGRRLNPRLARGLSLSVAFLVLVGAVGAVGLVMSQTRAVRGLALVDFPVLEWMVATRTEEAVRIARTLLRAFHWPGVVGLALPFAGLVAWRFGPVPALRVAVGLVGAGGGAYALDRLVLEGVVPGAEYPSVPVTVAAVLLVHATAVAARRWGWSPGVMTAGVGTFIVCAVALGTVVAGWAAPSGIALGLAMGLGWATLLELPRTLFWVAPVPVSPAGVPLDTAPGADGLDPAAPSDRASVRESTLNPPPMLEGSPVKQDDTPGTSSGDSSEGSDKPSKTPRDERDLQREEAEEAAQGDRVMEELHDDESPREEKEDDKDPA
jgi:membrane protein DedA with SNARE-associated domain